MSAPTIFALVQEGNTVIDTETSRFDDLLLPHATESGNVVPLRHVKGPRRRVHRGESLYEAGDSVHALYVVRLGVFKTFSISEDGLTQVTGFHITGDVIGLDGIDTEHHQSGVIALEDAEVFVLPFPHCMSWSLESAHKHRLMIRALAREIVRAQRIMLMLGTMRADQRVVAFLMDLSERYGRLGYSRSQLLLRMTRQDIGDFLGLKLETVSRVLSVLQREGLILVHGKSIALLDLPGLSRAGRTSTACSDERAEPIPDWDGTLKMTKEAGIGAVHRPATY